jgi:hypothetical protein
MDSSVRVPPAAVTGLLASWFLCRQVQPVRCAAQGPLWASATLNPNETRGFAGDPQLLRVLARPVAVPCTTALGPVGSGVTNQVHPGPRTPRRTP